MGFYLNKESQLAISLVYLNLDQYKNK